MYMYVNSLDSVAHIFVQEITRSVVYEENVFVQTKITWCVYTSEALYIHLIQL